MTFREKITKDNPEIVDEKHDGGVQGCPFNHGYESTDDRDRNAPCYGRTFRHNNELCTACWNREYVSQNGESKSDCVTELRNKIIDTCRRPNCPARLEPEIKELLGLFEKAVINEVKETVTKCFTEKWEVND